MGASAAQDCGRLLPGMASKAPAVEETACGGGRAAVGVWAESGAEREAASGGGRVEHP